METGLTMSPNRAAAYLGLGRTKTLELIREGRIEARDLDGRMRVTTTSLDAFLASLPLYKPVALICNK
jgi:excisionase family DNA binding protein